jgi:hypothetical protein
MMWLIATAFGLGVLTAAAGAYTLRNLYWRLADAKLVDVNAYLHEEVMRLRAQVALHIGTPKFPDA